LSWTAVEEEVLPSTVASDKAETIDWTCWEHSKRRVKRPVRFDDFVL
jgi:hypothetical protein